MELSELERGAEAGQLLCVDAVSLLRGCVRVEDEGDGWHRPCRLTVLQERAIGSCRAWHPGLFRQMARATAGVALAFRTNASEVVVELVVDAEPAGTRVVMRDVLTWQASHASSVAVDDCLVLEVDGRLRRVSLPSNDQRLVCLDLDDQEERPLPGLLQLPVLGGDHEVLLWLPALRGCAVRRLWLNGSFVEPLEERPCLLVLGDSIAQGFATGGSALSWPALVAGRLKMELLNQAVGGQVFQPESLGDLPKVCKPRAIIVAYGANYRYERCNECQTDREVRAYLREVVDCWPEVPTWAISPTWHDEGLSPSHARSCWEKLPAMIADHASRHPNMHAIDGLALLDANPKLFADGFEHPNALGAAQMAKRLHEAMRL